VRLWRCSLSCVRATLAMYQHLLDTPPARPLRQQIPGRWFSFSRGGAGKAGYPAFWVAGRGCKQANEQSRQDCVRRAKPSCRHEKVAMVPG
jgi:hypothetical protein